MSTDEGDQRRLLATCAERTGLSTDELWLRYFALGGDAGPVEVEAYLYGLLPLPAFQRDVLAHAINERLDELDWLRRVPYSRAVRQAKPATGPLAALVDLLDGAHRAPPERLPAVALAAGRELGVRLEVYLVDHAQRLLVPVLSEEGRDALAVDGTTAGRAFRAVDEVVETRDGVPRLWSVLLDGTDRLGVVEVTFADPAEARDPNLREQCRWLCRLLGHLVVTTGKYGDGLDLPRRRSSTPAVELLRDVRPPLTAGTDTVAVAGSGEPGTGAFDYALSETTAHLAIFDAGSGTPDPALVTAAALAAYRTARRGGLPLTGQAHAVEQELTTAFGSGRHAGGALAELDLRTGRTRFLTAGTARLLVVRDGGVTALDAGRRGAGFGGEAAEAVVEPGDWLLLHTGGVVGGGFGADRLADLLGRLRTEVEPPPEAARLLLRAVLDHDGGEPRGDVTVLLAVWSGPGGPRVRLEP
ncbi:SpoIIE family protein phosphatase [Umezawaea sp.]|uniref:SpoIIE family protein phosphatase n=1 Tax=Umezawaea sp. TaxID=1955258 RepID=UPI002ED4CE26